MINRRSETVDFIGLGKTSGGIARNLLERGHSLVVRNNFDEMGRMFGKMGATAAIGPAGVSRQASIVVTMADTTRRSQDVIVNPGGIIDEAKAGDIVVCRTLVDCGEG